MNEYIHTLIASLFVSLKMLQAATTITKSLRFLDDNVKLRKRKFYAANNKPCAKSSVATSLSFNTTLGLHMSLIFFAHSRREAILFLVCLLHVVGDVGNKNVILSRKMSTSASVCSNKASMPCEMRSSLLACKN